jgi:hypothetical protein
MRCIYFSMEIRTWVFSFFAEKKGKVKKKEVKIEKSNLSQY